MPTVRSIIISSCMCLIFEAAAINLDQNAKCFDSNSTLTTPGWTIPRGGIELEVGQPIEIYCMLDSTNNLTKNYTASDIVFRRGNTKIDSQYVTVVNSTAARLYMETLNSSVGTEYVYCNLNVRGDNVATLPPPANTSSLEMPSITEQMICSNAVTIGCKPQEVQNISCISEDLDNFICTWIEPNNGVKTDYSISYKDITYFNRAWESMQTLMQKPQNKWVTLYECRNLKPGKCAWGPWYLFSEYVVVFVDSTNKFGKREQSKFVHTYANTVPHAPIQLTALNSDLHSIYLKFNFRSESELSKGQFEDPSLILSERLGRLGIGLIYKVNYTWNNEAFWRINEYNSEDLRNEYNLVYINVTVPYPNVLYNIRISMRMAYNNSPWSEPSAPLLVRTTPCAPYRSPDTDIGSFVILPFPRESQSRDVLIYWQALLDEEHNSNNFKYEFVVFKDDVEVNIKPDKVEKTYAQFNNLSFNSSYTFVIKSTNDLGSAPYTTKVKLPRQMDVLPEPTLLTKVNFGGGVYKLSWNVPNATETNKRVANYTVFWCENYENYQGSYHCSNSLKWTHLSADTFRYRHNFTTNPSKAYQFAISVNSINSSSGMMWASCTVFHNQVNKMKNTWVNEVGSHYINLKWKLDCAERIEGIKGYNITYCSTSGGDLCTEPLKTYLINGDVTTDHGNITGLTPFTWYKISVAIFTDKSLGETSKWLENRTRAAAPNMAGVKVEVTNVTNSTAIVRWTPPSNPNGILDHYEVYYEPDKKITVSETFVQLIGLRSYDTYHIQVLACTTACWRTDPITFHTKIGTPGEVGNISTEKLNATEIKLKWEPPSVPAGPNPLYDVKMQFNELETSSNFSEFETNETEKVVEILCNQGSSHSAYSFFIRAKNIDNSDLNDIKLYYGPWSFANTVDCVNNAGISTMWKIIMYFSLCVVSFFILVFGGKKAFSECRQMSDIPVMLPDRFTGPPLCQDKSKNVAYHVDIKSFTILNKPSDDYQSSIDCIDNDLDADRKTNRSDSSDSGCYSS